jgi:hypothetical protein
MNKSRFVVSGLALAGLTIICSGADLTPTPDPFGGTKVAADWQPRGEGAVAAEKLFWQVFQSQDYAATPQLFAQLTTALAKTSDDSTKALLHGRLGWFYLWISAEDGYVNPPPPPAPQPQDVPGVTFPVPKPPNPGQGLLDYNAAAFPDQNRTPGAAAKLATVHFAAATKVVMDYQVGQDPSQRQDWTQVMPPSFSNPGRLRHGAWDRRRTAPSALPGAPCPGWSPASTPASATQITRPSPTARPSTRSPTAWASISRPTCSATKPPTWSAHHPIPATTRSATT